MSDQRKAGGGAPPVSRDIQLRTLKVTNLHENVTKELLNELFMQAGPIRNVVHRSDFAFIEFEDEDSVSYALALLDKVQLFGVELILTPKISFKGCYKFVDELKSYEQQIASNPINWWQKFGKPNHPMPAHICSVYLAKQQTRSMPYMYSHASESSHSGYPHVYPPAVYPYPDQYSITRNPYYQTVEAPSSHHIHHLAPLYPSTSNYYADSLLYDSGRHRETQSYYGTSRRGGKHDRPRHRNEKPAYHHKGSKSKHR